MEFRTGVWIAALTFGVGFGSPASGEDAVSLKTAISARHPGVQWIDLRTLSSLMDRHSYKRPVLLDARTKNEFETSHLRGARRIDPSKPNLKALRIPREALVVVYCSVGYRSAAIATQLQRAGVSKSYNLEGGIFAWANAGQPLYQGAEPATQVHPYDKLWGRFLRKDLHATLKKKPPAGAAKRRVRPRNAQR